MWFAFLLCFVSAVSCPKVDAPPNQPPSYVIESQAPVSVATLKRETRLQRQESFDEKCVPLKDFLAQISTDTTVTLRCDVSLRAQKLQIRLRQRKVSDIMESLALLLQGEWYQEGNGYRLSRTAEAAKRQKLWWSIYNRERSLAKQTISQAFLVAMRQPESDAATISDVALRTAVENAAKSGRFWRELPEPIQKMVSESFSDIYTYRRFWGSLPASFEGGVALDIADLPPGCRKAIGDSYRLLCERDIVWGDYSDVHIFSVGPRFYVNLVRVDGKEVAAGITLRSPDVNALPAFNVDHRWFPATLAERGSKISPAWKRLIEYQISPEWGEKFSPYVAPDPLPARLPDVLAGYAVSGDIDFISDYYSLPGRPASRDETVLKRDTMIDEKLNALSKTYDLSWKRGGGGVLLFRNNRWYRENILEAPLEECRQFAASLAAENGANETLPEQAKVCFSQMEVASQLTSRFTLWQIANGVLNYVDERRLISRPSDVAFAASPNPNCQPLSDIAELTLENFRLCQFFARLKSEDKLALFGDGLLIGKLDRSQRESLSLACPSVSVSETTGVIVRCIVTPRSFRLAMPGIFGNPNNGLPPYNINLIAEQRLPEGR